MPVRESRPTVLLFPGQGSQYVGMARNLCSNGAALFEKANEVLGYDLLSLCQNGPDELLNDTKHSQLAIFVSSMAAVERLIEMSNGQAVENCKAVAGISIGEFAALVFAGSMDFVDVLNILKVRSEATSKIAQAYPSGVMTIFDGDCTKINKLCALARKHCIESGMDEQEVVCTISSYLFPNGRTVAGHEKALQYITEHAEEFGIDRVKRIKVSAAFHTRIVEPARLKLREVLAKINIRNPKFKVYSNIDGQPYRHAEHIREAMERHVYEPVMWEQTMHNLYSDIERECRQLPLTYECGPYNFLTTLLGLNNPGARELAYNIES